MKHFFILNILFFLFLSNAGKCQFFGFLQGDPEQIYITALSQPHDGKYRVVNLRHSDLNQTPRPVQILTFDQNLQLTDSTRFPAGFDPSHYEPLKRNGKLFWPGSLCDTINNNYNIRKPAILEMDSNYHVITLYPLGGYDSALLFTSNLYYINKNFYGGWSHDFFGPSVIYKLDSLLVKKDSASYSGWVQEIYPINQDILIKGSGLPAPCPGNVDILVIDTTLNSLSCKTLVDYHVYEPCTKLIHISKTKYFVAGLTWVAGGNPGKRNAFINVLFDNNYQVIKSDTISYTPKNTAYVGFSNFVAYKGANILTTGIIDYNSSGWIENHNSQIFINKLDTVGNLVWEKIYGGDMFYMVNSIVFTDDGGCLIAGLRYDSTHVLYPGIMENFLLKLGADGAPITVGIISNGELKEISIKCFPNPTSENIYFDVPFQEEIEISIYDVSGREVKTILNYQNLQAIDIRDLPSAIYFYKIKTKGNNFVGKLVKTN